MRVTTQPYASITSDVGINQFLVVFPSNGSAAVTSDTEALGNPFSKWRSWGSALPTLTVAVQTVPQRISLKRDTMEQMGTTRAGFESSDYGGLVTGNPGLLWFMHVFTGSTATSIHAGTVIIEIIQHTEFYERAPIVDADLMIERMKKLKSSREERKIRNPHKVVAGLGSNKKEDLEEWDLRSNASDKGDRKEDVTLKLKEKEKQRSRSAK